MQERQKNRGNDLSRDSKDSQVQMPSLVVGKVLWETVEKQSARQEHKVLLSSKPLGRHINAGLCY